MDYETAQEIMNIKGVVDVRYHGQSVWIKGVNTNGETAEIKALDGSFDHREVYLSELVEL